jgi:hypothetical protein
LSSSGAPKLIAVKICPEKAMAALRVRLVLAEAKTNMVNPPTLEVVNNNIATNPELAVF